MGSYIKPKEGAVETKYTVKVGSKSLLLTTHETSESVSIYIGGHTVYCVNALIYKKDSVYSRAFDTSIGSLPNVYYNLNCSLEHDFKRGVDTDMILKLIQSFIKKEYPHVKMLRFNDASYRECDNGHFIDLAAMSYFTTGQTWYEKHFHAYLVEESEIIYKKALEGIDKKKEQLPWEAMRDYITSELPFSETKMKELYETSKSFLDFFGTIRTKIGVPKFCVFAAPWFGTFINEILHFNIINLKYIMPIHFNIPYTIGPYVSGGRGFTRKNMRSRRPRNET